MVPALGHEEPRASTGVSPASRTVCGQVFRPRERAFETTFRPDRAPVSGTSTGHFLGLNPVSMRKNAAQNPGTTDLFVCAELGIVMGGLAYSPNHY